MKKIIGGIIILTLLCVIGCNDKTKNEKMEQTFNAHMKCFEGKVVEILDDNNTVKLEITKERYDFKKNEMIIMENDHVTLEDYHNDENAEPTTVDENYKLKVGDIVSGQDAADSDYKIENGMRRVKSSSSIVSINENFDKKAK